MLRTGWWILLLFAVPASARPLEDPFPLPKLIGIHPEFQRPEYATQLSFGPPPASCVERIEIKDIAGPKRLRSGWGHEFAVEIGSFNSLRHCSLEWWEYVTYDGSQWYTKSIFPSADVEERRWQDHCRINPESRMWVAWRDRGDSRSVRIVDRPAIPLGNLKLGRDGKRKYANLSRKLLIEVRVRCHCGLCAGKPRSVFVLQSLREKAGRPAGALIAHGASRFDLREALSRR
jgi:hypothetical protein